MGDPLQKIFSCLNYSVNSRLLEIFMRPQINICYFQPSTGLQSDKAENIEYDQ